MRETDIRRSHKKSREHQKGSNWEKIRTSLGWLLPAGALVGVIAMIPSCQGNCQTAKANAGGKIIEAAPLLGFGLENCIYRDKGNKLLDEGENIKRAEGLIEGAERDLSKWACPAPLVERSIVLAMRGFLQFKAEKYDEAIRTLERVGSIPEEKDGNAHATRADVVITLAWSYVGEAEKRGTLDQAVLRMQIDRLGEIKETPCALTTKGQLRRRLALLQADNGQVAAQEESLRKALDEFDLALKERRSFFLAHYNKGIVLMDLGRLDEAIAAFKRATEIDPNDAYAHSELSYAYEDKGQYKMALEEAERAASLNPEEPDHAEHLGEMLVKLKCYKEALEVFAPLIPNARVQHGRGQALLGLDKHNEEVEANLCETDGGRTGGVATN